MKFTIEVEVKHQDGTGRDDPERVADIAYYQLLDGKAIEAGAQGEARYTATSYRFVSGESETDDDGEDLDVLPEPVS